MTESARRRSLLIRRRPRRLTRRPRETAGLAAAGALHTGVRYFFGKASAFLPGELARGETPPRASCTSPRDERLQGSLGDDDTSRARVGRTGSTCG